MNYHKFYPEVLQSDCITIELARVNELYAPWRNKSIVEFTIWLTDLVNKVALEHRHAITLDLHVEDDYDDAHYGELIVSYVRPMNAGELEQRTVREIQRQQRQEASERNQLALLKARYEYEKEQPP